MLVECGVSFLGFPLVLDVHREDLVKLGAAGEGARNSSGSATDDRKMLERFSPLRPAPNIHLYVTCLVVRLAGHAHEDVLEGWIHRAHRHDLEACVSQSLAEQIHDPRPPRRGGEGRVGICRGRLGRQVLQADVQRLAEDAHVVDVRRAPQDRRARA